MATKKVYSFVLGLTEEEEEELYIIAGKMGLTVSELIKKIIDDLPGKKPKAIDRDKPVKAWLGKMFAKFNVPSFLAYLLGLSNGDLREFIDCLIFLKRKQNEIKKIDTILQYLMKGPIEALDEVLLSELTRVCGIFGVEVDEKNIDAIKVCLVEEKETIHGKMYVADMGFEPDNLYSAVDVVVQTFHDYCRTYDMDYTDINEEMKKVINWLEENEKQFQPID